MAKLRGEKFGLTNCCRNAGFVDGRPGFTKICLRVCWFGFSLRVHLLFHAEFYSGRSGTFVWQIVNLLRRVPIPTGKNARLDAVCRGTRCPIHLRRNFLYFPSFPGTHGMADEDAGFGELQKAAWCI